MNRREMMTATAVSPLAGLVPPFGGDAVVSAPDLLHRIESGFECVDGEPRAYFEGIYPSGRFGRGVYVTFVNGEVGHDGGVTQGLESKARALNALRMAFEAYAVGKAGKLYWRKRPEVRRVTPADALAGRDYIETLPGLWQSRISSEDGLRTIARTPEELGELGDRYYARMRLVITDLRPYVEQPEFHHDPVYTVDHKTGEVWQ